MATQKLNDQARDVWENHFGTENEGKDFNGKKIVKSSFEDSNSEFGWTIEYITPLKDGGKDEMANKRPVSIKNATAHEKSAAHSEKTDASKKVADAKQSKPSFFQQTSNKFKSIFKKK